MPGAASFVQKVAAVLAVGACAASLLHTWQRLGPVGVRALAAERHTLLFGSSDGVQPPASAEEREQLQPRLGALLWESSVGVAAVAAPAVAAVTRRWRLAAALVVVAAAALAGRVRSAASVGLCPAAGTMLAWDVALLVGFAGVHWALSQRGPLFGGTDSSSSDSSSSDSSSSSRGGGGHGRGLGRFTPRPHLSRSVFAMCSAAALEGLLLLWSPTPLLVVWDVSSASRALEGHDARLLAEYGAADVGTAGADNATVRTDDELLMLQDATASSSSAERVLWILFTLGCVLTALSAASADVPELTGLRAGVDGANSRGRAAPPLAAKDPSTRVLYSHARHPMAIGPILVLFATPLLTLDRLLLAVAATAYILTRHRLDENDLQFVVDSAATQAARAREAAA